MASGRGLSGFPEWLPEQELVQQRVIALIREQFELHGFTPIHTRSLERMEDLVSQGETEKEIYVVHRHARDASDDDDKLGLHYDLTVPFARYVGENRGRLVFPFRRYQIQQAWRGERPQLGRFREFIQADIDVIGMERLDVRHDAEMVSLLHRIMERLPFPHVKLQVNNRKLLEGFYRGIGIDRVVETLRVVDKLNKIGPDGVTDGLVALGLSLDQASACIRFCGIEAATPEELDAVRELGASHPLFDEGLAELRFVLETCARQGARPGAVVAALHVARGFDYYTGTVVEGVLADHGSLGAVCSGGRYDNLASEGNVKLPGVGVSIGVTRLLSYCFHLGLLETGPKTPAKVVVAVHSDRSRDVSDAAADALRDRGIPCLVSDRADAYGRQMAAAERLGVRYLWFPAYKDRGHAVKDLVTGEQVDADPTTWRP
ncbi:MAG TPA: histidine--tRNA ligase [Myxococcota bacterium]|nr:histidine--tRNA ligase [Myxococcota bacterium]